MTSRYEEEEWQEDEMSILQDAIVTELSPEAVVAIAAHLQSAKVRDEKVNAEIRWFQGFLAGMVSVEEYNRIADEIGA